MRLQLIVNGNICYTAQCAEPGYLSAHLNLVELTKEGESSKTVRVRATQIADAQNTSLKWPEIGLDTGDVVELRILPDGESDPPSAIRSSTEDPSNLFSNFQIAAELTKTVSAFDKQLLEILGRAKEFEPDDEYKKIHHAVAQVIYETGARLLYPIFRRHKALMPEDLKGGLLQL